MTTTQTETVVLHGKTRWSESLADYVFRPDIEFTTTFPGKYAVTHREGSKCLSRTPGEMPTPEPIAKTKGVFENEVERQRAGEDRTAWFCTRCLIHLPADKLAAEQIAARAAKAVTTDEFNTGPAEPEPLEAVAAAKPKPAGSRITRPSRGRKAPAKKA